MRLVPLFALAAAAFAQGTTPKPKAEEYPVNARVTVAGQPVALGAEYMVHSFSQGEEAYIAPDYLVIEVALYSAKDTRISVQPAQFALRVNGKKQSLTPQSPQMVAASLANPQWRSGPRLEGGGGLGGIGVGLGRPRSPIPGQDPASSPVPRVPRDNPGGVEPRQHVNPMELVVQTALPAGDFKGPVSGFLYFAYKGKPAGIKTLQLLYADAVLELK